MLERIKELWEYYFKKQEWEVLEVRLDDENGGLRLRKWKVKQTQRTMDTCIKKVDWLTCNQMYMLKYREPID